MQWSKKMSVNLGVMMLWLIFSGLFFQPTSRAGAVQSNNHGTGNSGMYLPIMMRAIPFTTKRVSVASDGTQGNKESLWPDISDDGRYVVFSSLANNLISGDTNNTMDVFVHDTQAGQTTRVSVASDGTQGNEQSGYYDKPVISADGRYVAFGSGADNLVSGDTNNNYDIFVHDRQTGQTRMVSIASSGVQGNWSSLYPSISADGRYIAFASFSTNLVNGDTNARMDVFIHDQQTGQTQRISKASNGTQGDEDSYRVSISADSRYIAFVSDATNLINGDTNDTADVFIHDRQTAQTNRISVSSDGTQGNSWSGWVYYPSISSDGRYVAFASDANNLVNGDTNDTEDIFVHDCQTGQTSRVSVASDGTQGGGASNSPSISANGRYVAFGSSSRNWTPIQISGIFIHDRQTDQLYLASVNPTGVPGNSGSEAPSISGDGRYVTFHSLASNLVNDDTNYYEDVFIHDRGE